MCATPDPVGLAERLSLVDEYTRFVNTQAEAIKARKVYIDEAEKVIRNGGKLFAITRLNGDHICWIITTGADRVVGRIPAVTRWALLRRLDLVCERCGSALCFCPCLSGPVRRGY